MKYIPFILMISLAGGYAHAESATEIIAKVEKSLSPPNFRALYQFTNHRLDGTTATYDVRFSIKDANHSHGYFLKPEREKGRETLRLKDTIWTYMPSVARAVRVADRESFAGGDFSNADVLRVDWLAQYNATLAKDSKNQSIIDLVSKNSDAAYAKMRLWVDKSTTQPVQQYFYDNKGTLLKICKYGSVKTFGSISRPTRMEMENVITKQKSEMQILELSFDSSLPAGRFVVDNLGKEI
ncbi:MAG: outer membrane lipoprotein-sorting protein [Bdellovibrionales bacterium]|nr:outer membrane lipoprotein-sorting protein [Bdellovibrionales bacterium]